MAGLSLAYYISKDTNLRSKKVLIIDPDEKNKNDRTWGFWTKDLKDYDAILTQKWDALDFVGPNGDSLNLNIFPYSYKLLRGIDFYRFTKSELNKNSNIQFKRSKAVQIETKEQSVEIKCDDDSIIKGKFVFDSTLKPDLTRKGHYHFLQHFKGAVISLKKDSFDPSKPTLMDFSIPNYGGLCNFIYVLPFDAKTALVEYTVFSEKLLTEEEYSERLYKNYLDVEFGPNSYEIIEEEFGVIPMSDSPLRDRKSPRHYYIGISGGATNAATGYTFAAAQNQLKDLVNHLKKEQIPSQKNWWNKRTNYYSSVLLDVLKNDRIPLGQAFYELFQRNRPSHVFSFLDGTSSFLTELKIMWSTQKRHFALAAWNVLITRFFKR